MRPHLRWSPRSPWAEATAPAEPGESALDHPSTGQHLESLGRVGSLDDLERYLRFGANVVGRCLALIAAVGDGPRQRGEHPARHLEERRDHVTILNIARRDGEADHQAKRVDGHMALLALDFLARIIAGSVDVGPPFSAPLTLWLSTMAVVAAGFLAASLRASA